MTIRMMTQHDSKLAISRVYEESWKYAYKNIIPQSFLDRIPTGKWASNLDKDGRKTLIMLEDNEIIGTSSFCESRFSEFQGMGEIISIYLLPQHIGKEYGTHLLHAAINELKKLGYHKIFLWVLEENYPAIKFYEKNGFIKTDKFLDDNIGGKTLREIQYILNSDRRLYGNN